MAEDNNIGQLFARIAKIAGLVGGIAKDRSHEQNYGYHSADSVMGHLNKLMAEHGLAIVPTVIETTIVEGRDDIQRWLITYEFIIGDVDGNSMTARWTGEAPMYGKRKDGTLFTDDKSIGKAHTYAYKYYLMKLFMISTVDTDDLDTNSQQSVKPAKSGQKDNLSPESHGLGNGKSHPQLFITNPITDFEIRQDEKGDKKPYIVAAGITLFSRAPFRDLEYSKQFTEGDMKAGKFKFDTEEAFQIQWYRDGQKKVPVMMRRVSNGKEVEIK